MWGDRYKLRGPAGHRWWGLTLLRRALLIFCRVFIPLNHDREAMEMWRFLGFLTKGYFSQTDHRVKNTSILPTSPCQAIAELAMLLA